MLHHTAIIDGTVAKLGRDDRRDDDRRENYRRDDGRRDLMYERRFSDLNGSRRRCGGWGRVRRGVSTV